MGEENHFFKVLLADMEKWTKEVSVRYFGCSGSEKLFNSMVHLLYLKEGLYKEACEALAQI